MLVTMVVFVLGVLQHRDDRAARSTAVSAIAPAPVAQDGTVLVVRAIDGDTIELEGGALVRYLGIDTPETVDPRKSVQCFGPEASQANHAFVDGKRVRLVADVEDRDQYGRMLRYVYLVDGTFVNLALAQQGFAAAYTYPPNVAHAEDIRAAVRTARKEGRGLWASCRGVRTDRGEDAYQKQVRKNRFPSTP
ncbi:thermonuclease family protein [Candidatus Uhrbacteria bacterium]|nr:thermonuclease family protein [Candidatus Uhrbacteria bacterium]